MLKSTKKSYLIFETSESDISSHCALRSALLPLSSALCAMRHALCASCLKFTPPAQLNVFDFLFNQGEIHISDSLPG
jgi:hypothetical protein